MSETISWPDWMPRPQHGSFSIQPEDRRTVTDMDAGTTLRVEYDADVNVATCELVLNPVQSAWFEAFERDILVQGSVWFRFPLWIGGEIVYELCRFKERPAAGSLIGLHTTYSFSLYVATRELMPQCLAKILTEFSPCCLEGIGGALDELFGILSHVTTSSVAAALP